MGSTVTIEKSYFDTLLRRYVLGSVYYHKRLPFVDKQKPPTLFANWMYRVQHVRLQPVVSGKCL